MSKALIIKLIIFYSNLYGMDPRVSLAVAQNESSLNPNAVGQALEVGLFQLKPEYVKEYSRAQLFDPVNNIKAGIKRLIETKKQCVHKKAHNYLVCYNFGKENAKRVRHPELFPYVIRVNNIIRTMKQTRKLASVDII